MTKELNTPTDIDPDNGSERVAIWSMDNELLLSKQPAIDGECTICYPQYNKKRKNPRLTATSPTYRDLFDLANTLILMSGDMHHVFIEGFNHDPETDTWNLQTGS